MIAQLREAASVFLHAALRHHNVPHHACDCVDIDYAPRGSDEPLGCIVYRPKGAAATQELHRVYSWGELFTLLSDAVRCSALARSVRSCAGEAGHA